MHIHTNNTVEAKLFILRALRNPLRLGALTPSSRYLGALLARHAVIDDDSPVIELGGGTGALTRALIKAGIDPARIYVIELDSALAAYLKAAIPQVKVIQGNAVELSQILPSELIGKVRRVVSGLPMINIPGSVQQKILDSCFQIMAPGGVYLQYTYSPRSSIDAKANKLRKKRLGTTFRNFPPATVWQYTRE